jgi:hypothetical protein
MGALNDKHIRAFAVTRGQLKESETQTGHLATG